jgi:hypothetical protein
MSITKATGRFTAFAVVIGAASVLGVGQARAEDDSTPLVTVSGVTLPPVPTIEVNVGPLDPGGLPTDGLVPGVTLPELGGGLPVPDLGGGLPVPDLGGGLPVPDLGGGLPVPDLGGGLPVPDLGGGLPVPDLGGGLPVPDLGGGLPVPDLGGGLPVPDLGGGLPVPDLGGGLPVPDLGGGVPELPIDPAMLIAAANPVIGALQAVLNTIGLGFLLEQVPVGL